jgi:hypothetical protein
VGPPTESSAYIKIARWREQAIKLEGIDTWGGYSGGEETPTELDLRVFEVGVLFPVELSEDEILHQSGDPSEVLLTAINDAAELAESTALLLKRWARLDQAWLGFGDVIERITHAPVRVEKSGAIVPIGPTITLAVTLSMGGPMVTPEAMGNLMSHLREGVEPPPAAALLADARYLGRWRHPPDLVRAILLAAISCEVMAKEALLDLAPEMGRVLELTLRRARWSDLFDNLPRAIAGRSLKEEDRETYGRIGRLFELRNDIAHWAKHPDPTEAVKSLKAAEAAFAWFDGLEI